MSSLTLSLSFYCVACLYFCPSSSTSKWRCILITLKMAPCFPHLYRNRCCPAFLAPYVLCLATHRTLFPRFLLSRIPRNETVGHLFPLRSVCSPSLLHLPLFALLHVAVITLICHLNEHGLSVDALFMKMRESLECTY